MMKRNLIAIGILTLVFTSNVFGQTKPEVQKPSQLTKSDYKTDRIVLKKPYLSQSNVVRSIDVNFDKTFKDATGKQRRIQISKAEYLKTPGFRYYAKVDGEARDITYLVATNFSDH